MNDTGFKDVTNVDFWERLPFGHLYKSKYIAVAETFYYNYINMLYGPP